MIELKSHKRFCIIFANNRYFFFFKDKTPFNTNSTGSAEVGADIEKKPRAHDGVNMKPKKVKMEKVETLKCFMLDTTLHGARFVFAKSLPRRCLWTLILVGSFAFCQYHTYESWMQFLQRPFSVGITLKSTKESTLTFPAVTLCNVNPQNVQRALHLLDTRNKEDAKQIIDDVTKLLQFSKESVNEDILERYPEFFDRDKIVARWTFNSHQIGEMLLPNIPPTYTSCSFDGVLCGTENFSSFASSCFGQCYTFNSGQNGSQMLTARIPGRNNGLKLRLNIQRNGYIKYPKNPFAGITLFVHDQNNFPFMEEYGFLVEPGTHTFIPIKMKKVSEMFVFKQYLSLLVCFNVM